MRFCSVCGLWKVAGEFVVDGSKVSGFASRCRVCDAERCRAYYARNREERKRLSRERAARVRASRPAGPPRLCVWCGAPTPTRRHSYCAVCVLTRPRRRPSRRRDRGGSTGARGYGSAHQKLRKVWKARVDAGGVRCARCGGMLVPGEPWDLGHDDFDRSRYTGPEHARCNRATSGRRKKLKVRAPRAAWW